MMPNTGFIVTTACLLLVSAFSSSASNKNNENIGSNGNLSLLVSNQLDEVREDAALIISDQKILDRLTASATSIVALKPEGLSGQRLSQPDMSQNIYGQLDDLDQNGEVDEAFFLLDMSSREHSVFTAGKVNGVTIEPRTQFVIAVRQNGSFNAEGEYISGGGYVPVDTFDVPAEQEQDSKLAYMEGPVWESDRIGFRYYLDDRNRYDVFGKSQPALVLHSVSGDYHALSDWGADVLKVGKSTGLGSIAIMTDEGPKFIDNVEKKKLKLLANGPFRSILRTTYEGWKPDESESVDVISDLEIRVGASWTEQRLHLKGAGDYLMTTGIVKHAAAPEFITGTEAGVFFGYTWGSQADQGELLGMAIIIPEAFNPKAILNDQHSHLITYQLVDDRASYRFMAGWELGTVPYKEQADFEAAVRKVARRYAQPVTYK